METGLYQGNFPTGYPYYGGYPGRSYSGPAWYQTGCLSLHMLPFQHQDIKLNVLPYFADAGIFKHTFKFGNDTLISA
jgi:hypothetical protein